MSDYKVTDTQLSSIADAIRTKAGVSSQLAFPSGFISAVQAIPTGSCVYVSKTITSNGEYDPTDDSADAYSHVTVSVPSGGLPVLSSATFSQNGSYSVPSGYDGFGNVVVDVPSGGGSNDNYLIMMGLSSGVISDSSITEIPKYAFAFRASNKGYGLTGASFPEVTKIGSSAFFECTDLEDIYFPKCTQIDNEAFKSCKTLQKAEFSQCSIISNGAFAGCSLLSEIIIPKCTQLGTAVFDGCLTLNSISLYVSYITTSAFRSCNSLESVYLLSDSITILSNVNAFVSTPLSIESYLGHFGSIYVPSSLVSSYKTANNWSKYADRITSYVEE